MKAQLLNSPRAGPVAGLGLAIIVMAEPGGGAAAATPGVPGGIAAGVYSPGVAAGLMIGIL